MKKELQSKDMLIQDLNKRLMFLEERINSIQREEQRDKS